MIPENCDDIAEIGGNGTILADQSGEIYAFSCNLKPYGPAYYSRSALSLSDCLSECDTSLDCGSVYFADGFCYFSEVATRYEPSDDIIIAVRADPPPAAYPDETTTT